MKEVSGRGIGGGVAMGKLLFFKPETSSFDKGRGYDPGRETARLKQAAGEADEALARCEEDALTRIGGEEAAVFGIHRMMLQDPDYMGKVRNMLAQGYGAEYSVQASTEELAELFAGSGDEYMAARAEDIRDVGRRLLQALTGRGGETLSGVGEPVVLLADHLSPGETMGLDKSKIAAFLTCGGSVNSHTAILARSLGLPAVVAMGEKAWELHEGKPVFVDGDAGRVVESPDPSTVAYYEARKKEQQEERLRWEKMRGKTVRAPNGRPVMIYANIGNAKEAEEALAADAEGVGLFRSEFLYLHRDSLPDEEEQFAAYKKVLETLAGRRTVIRTLDIGADKQAGYLGLAPEDNPAMGLRAIRLCLSRPALFRTQLRALLRASVYGKLAILFPMIASVSELKAAREMLEETAEELEREGIPHSYEVEVGIMIETPAAALMADTLAEYVDFFSVGTNDLAQYTLAMDRQNEAIAPFYDSHHEAVLTLVAMATKAAHEHGIWIGICGELAADTALTDRFLSMGVDELSVSPGFILPLKAAIGALTLEKAGT